jgi:hypothetical protein
MFVDIDWIRGWRVYSVRLLMKRLNGLHEKLELEKHTYLDMTTTLGRHDTYYKSSSDNRRIAVPYQGRNVTYLFILHSVHCS